MEKCLIVSVIRINGMTDTLTIIRIMFRVNDL
jgi:hypothetical protein